MKASFTCLPNTQLSTVGSAALSFQYTFPTAQVYCEVAGSLKFEQSLIEQTYGSLLFLLKFEKRVFVNIWKVARDLYNAWLREWSTSRCVLIWTLLHERWGLPNKIRISFSFIQNYIQKSWYRFMWQILACRWGTEVTELTETSPIELDSSLTDYFSRRFRQLSGINMALFVVSKDWWCGQPDKTRVNVNLLSADTV